MIPIVTSLTLDRATLCHWVQSALAAEVLTVPSEVIDIQVDEEIVHNDLRPVAASPAVTMLPTEPPAIVKPSTNGNGHKPARSGQFITDAHKTLVRIECPQCKRTFAVRETPYEVYCDCGATLLLLIDGKAILRQPEEGEDDAH